MLSWLVCILLVFVLASFLRNTKPKNLGENVYCTRMQCILLLIILKEKDVDWVTYGQDLPRGHTYYL